MEKLLWAAIMILALIAISVVAWLASKSAKETQEDFSPEIGTFLVDIHMHGDTVDYRTTKRFESKEEADAFVRIINAYYTGRTMIIPEMHLDSKIEVHRNVTVQALLPKDPSREVSIGWTRDEDLIAQWEAEANEITWE